MIDDDCSSDMTMSLLEDVKSIAVFLVGLFVCLLFYSFYFSL